MNEKGVIDAERIRQVISKSVEVRGRTATMRKARIGAVMLDDILTSADIRGLRLESLDAISAAFRVPPEMLITTGEKLSANALVAQLEQALLDEGVPAESVRKLINDIHMKAMLLGIRPNGFFEASDEN